MNLSAPFIHRPVATTLLTVAIALAGAIAYFRLPVSPLPQVEFPTIQVSASLPGASPETMATSVATPLERQLGAIAGVTEMTSVSSLGSVGITMQFDLSRNIDGAARDVQAAISASRAQLPSALPGNPRFHKSNPADAPIMILTLTSEIYGKAAMYDAASSILQQKISQVEGVGQVFVGGGALPAVRVEVNPSAVNNLDLSLADIRALLGAANTNRPKGEVVIGDRTYSLASNSQLSKADDYKNLVVKYVNKAPVVLSSVAEVVDSVEDLHTAGGFNGKPAISLIIFRQTGANIIDTVDRIYAQIPQWQAEIPAAMKLEVSLDRTTTIRASVADVQFTLLLSIVLVILVVFLFLRSIRTTFIPTVAVPVSLVATFGAMYLLGYSIDNLSLMALTIATGFVVDDAIVVIENISRHLEEGMPPMKAALHGAREIGFTVLSISVSLVAVFIPILLMGGIVGRMFREFAVTLAIAIGVSMVVSLTTTPMMCAFLLKNPREERHGRLFNFSERGFDAVLRFYSRSLAWVLKHQFATLLVTLGTVAVTVLLYIYIPKGFFPQQDTGRLGGQIRGDQSTSSQAMAIAVDKFARAVADDKEDVDGVIAFSGGGRGSSNSGNMYVSLKPLGQRKVSADEVIAKLRKKTAHIPGATLTFQAVQDLKIGGRGSAAQFQFSLHSDNLQELNVWAPKMQEAMEKISGLVDVNSDQQNGGLQILLDSDRATAARVGNITQQNIDDAVYDAFGQRQVSTIYAPLNQYHVVMEADPKFANGPEDLQHIYVRAPSGAIVPLAVVAKRSMSNTPLAINHSGTSASVTISFNLAPGVSLGEATPRIEKAAADIGLPATIHTNFSGAAQAFQDSLSNMAILVLAALLTVYIVLGILYESLIHPITILSTLPSAGVGALVALMVCDVELSVIAIIGIILLIGIVKKNAIMMIDFALEAERSQDLSPTEAIYKACILRFRPIIMTTMAALLGGLPLAIGVGTGAELRRPLGIAIVGGLIFSQMLTLYTTPVVYIYMDRLRMAINRMFHRPEALAPIDPAA